MTNSPLEQTPREDFCLNSSLFFGSLFNQTDISLEWTLSASPKIFLSRKCLYIFKNNYKFPDGSVTQHKLFSLKVWKESLFRHIKSSSRVQKKNIVVTHQRIFFPDHRKGRGQSFGVHRGPSGQRCVCHRWRQRIRWRYTSWSFT